MDDIKPSVTHSDTVKDYYERVLKSSADLKTSAYCPTESPPEHIRGAEGRAPGGV